MSLFHCQNSVDIIIESKSQYDRQAIDQYSSEKCRHGGHHNVKQLDRCVQDCDRCYVDDDVCEWIDYQPGTWLWDYIKNTAVIRFFEIWGDRPRSNLKIFNGLGINKKREPSVAGLLSILYQTGMIEKVKDEGWVFKGIQPRKVTKSKFLSLQIPAIIKCREVANQFLSDTKKDQIPKSVRR